MERFIAGCLLAWLTLAAPAGADRGWHFGKTSAGLVSHFMDDQVPEYLEPDKSRPKGFELSQEFYSGYGFRTRLQGQFAWQNAVDRCFFVCIDYNASGHYFWDTRYAETGLRFSPDLPGLPGGLGLELGYAWFQYRWGIYKEGWDSPYPSGVILAGTYRSHQAVLGLGYEHPFRMAGMGFAIGAGMKKVLAGWNTLSPKMLAGGVRSIEGFDFPERPWSWNLSLKAEW